MFNPKYNISWRIILPHYSNIAEILGNKNANQIYGFRCCFCCADCTITIVNIDVRRSDYSQHRIGRNDAQRTGSVVTRRTRVRQEEQLKRNVIMCGQKNGGGFFEKCKSELVSAIKLAGRLSTAQLVLRITDASERSLGSVVDQRFFGNYQPYFLLKKYNVENSLHTRAQNVYVFE